jgi:glycosyltransferase involved in cell wall biosynthesis
MVNSAKISIVMPCLNSVDYIERSIRSVVEQDYQNIELYIKDGGSKDSTIDIIKHYAKKYPEKIRWETGADKGQADAINIGMRKAKGEIIAFLNADDVYKPGALKLIDQYFSDNPKTMWLFGKCDIIDGDDKVIRRFITIYKNFWLLNYSYATLLILNYISQMGCFWRREAAEKIGNFDIKQNYVMDYDYWLRLGSKYPAGVINDYIASFRITSTSKSSIGFLKQFKDEFNVARKRTDNPVIIFLHYLNYFGIITIYSIIKYINSFNAPKMDIE